MNKVTKSLPQGIKIIVDRYGKNVLNDVRFVNIMSDVVSLDESLAVKNTFREIIKLGYGKKILSLVSAKGDNTLKMRVYAKDIADTQGYKEVFVQYILYSLAFSVGLCQEPYLKNVEKNPKPRQETVQEESHQDTKVTISDKTNLYRILVGFFGFALLVGGIYLYQYIGSSDDREQYDQRIFSGNTFLSEGDYENAIESYKEAYNGYNALNSNSYKEAALFRMDDLVDKLMDEGADNNKSLLQAYKVLQSEMQLNLEKDEYSKLQLKKEKIENLISTRVSNGRNGLVTILSANGGKLNEEGKDLLNELLELSPEDYWLNFIKKKSYE